jgi:hypothetical protein
MCEILNAMYHIYCQPLSKWHLIEITVFELNFCTYFPLDLLSQKLFRVDHTLRTFPNLNGPRCTNTLVRLYCSILLHIVY